MVAKAERNLEMGHGEIKASIQRGPKAYSDVMDVKQPLILTGRGSTTIPWPGSKTAS